MQTPSENAHHPNTQPLVNAFPARTTYPYAHLKKNRHTLLSTPILVAPPPPIEPPPHLQTNYPYSHTRPTPLPATHKPRKPGPPRKTAP
ncbi:hypothetical protein GCM10020220_046590 [Nonomuraea rubra]